MATAEGGNGSEAPAQQKEVIEEAYANGDGSEVLSKRTTRVVSTSQSSVTGSVLTRVHCCQRGGDVTSVFCYCRAGYQSITRAHPGPTQRASIALCTPP
jgi:hypothetical protein